MKKTHFIIVIIYLIGIYAYGQDNSSDSRESMQLGIKIGANYSNVYDEKGDEFYADPKFGFVAGVFLSIPIGKYLGFQPEVLFSQKGYKSTGSLLGLDYGYTRTTNYLDIPLLVQLKPTDFITLLAGPQFSYLMKQKDVFDSDILNSTQEQEFENDNIRKNVLCFLGGVDFNLDPLILGLRAGWDIQDNNGDGTTTTPRYKNVWYQVTFGFQF